MFCLLYLPNGKPGKVAFFEQSNIHTSCLARWKARGRLLVSKNCACFHLLYGWGTASGNLSSQHFLKG